MLRIISGNMSSIKRINISGCVHVSNAGLICLSTQLDNIERLQIAECLLITDTGMKRILHDHGDFLRDLDISRCPKVSSY